MERLTLMCDRCGKDVEAERGQEGNYFDVSNDSKWHRFAKPCEQIVCHECMYQDPVYKAIYGLP